MSPKHVASSAEDREMVIPAMAADIPPDIFIVADVDDLLAELRRIAAALPQAATWPDKTDDDDADRWIARARLIAARLDVRGTALEREIALHTDWTPPELAAWRAHLAALAAEIHRLMALTGQDFWRTRTFLVPAAFPRRFEALMLDAALLPAWVTPQRLPPFADASPPPSSPPAAKAPARRRKPR